MNILNLPFMRYAGWLLLALYLVMGGAGLALEYRAESVIYRDGVQPDLGYVNYLTFAIWSVVGALLISRRPRNPIGYCFALLPLLLMSDEFTYGYAYFGLITAPGSLPLAGQVAVWNYWTGKVLGLGLLGLTFLLLPNGELPSPRWKRVLWLIGGITLVYMVAAVINPEHPLNPLSSTWLSEPPVNLNPFGLQAGTLRAFYWVKWVTYGLLVFWLFLTITALFVRLRHAKGIERQQLKWIVFAASFLIPGISLIVLGVAVGSSSSAPNRFGGVLLVTLSTGGIAVASAIAILRYRLFDIDIIIRKTLQYTIVTGLLLLVYFGVVVVLQRLLAPITGESDLAVVLSTLFIAAFFLPLRRRVQDAIDRRFFRKKYDAEKVLQQFAATARDETDLDALTAELLRVIQQTMEPEHVSLWLRQTTDDRPWQIDE